MVRELVHDPILLAQKSDNATKDDLAIARDLLDTLTAHKESCVGMAANMIGQTKRIIAFDNNGSYMVMLNPTVIRAEGPYEAESSFRSLPMPFSPQRAVRRSRVRSSV